VEMSLTEIFTPTGVLGHYEESLGYWLPESAGLSCPVEVSGVRLMERSPFICNDDERIRIDRISNSDRNSVDFSLICEGPNEWFLDWQGAPDLLYYREFRDR
jgi:hypothetical protein